MPRSTAEDLIWARSGTRPIHAVRWTLNQARIVRTKKRGHELLMVWKKWKERQGWNVRGSNGNGYIATSPTGTKEAAALRTYDPVTLAEYGKHGAPVVPPLPKRKPKPRVEEFAEPVRNPGTILGVPVEDPPAWLE